MRGPGRTFLRIARLDSCIEYYQCYMDRAYLMKCPKLTWFNEEDQDIDEKESKGEGTSHESKEDQNESDNNNDDADNTESNEGEGNIESNESNDENKSEGDNEQGNIETEANRF
ncbi:hypothetical protein ACJJTC_005582 [Scirpophaga incertulas]